LLTGIATLWFGLLVVTSVDYDFEGMISRMVERGVLPEATDHSSLMQLLLEKAYLSARIVSLITAVAMFAAFAFSVYLGSSGGKMWLTVPATIGSYIAGSYLGRIVSYGRLANHLIQAKLQISIFPEHVDGVGG